MMPRLIRGAAVILAAVLGGLPAAPLRAQSAAAPAASAVPVAAHQTRGQKVAELTADLGYGTDIRHVDAAIAPLTADVAPADPTWNPTHRHWAAVRGMVKTALRDDAERTFGELEERIREGAQHALDEGVVGEDLDAGLAFFRSSPGKSFQELQDELTNLSIEISFEKTADAVGVSVENLDARKRIVELWLPIVFIRAVYPPQTAERSIDTVYEKFSRLRGRELDALAEKHAADLTQIESFIHSAAFGRIIDAERHSAQSTPAPNLGAFFDIEAARHGAEWHAAYAAP